MPNLSIMRFVKIFIRSSIICLAIFISACSLLGPSRVKVIGATRINVVHTVSGYGESFQTISQKITGNSQNWTLIRLYNPAFAKKKLKPGNRIRVPKKLVKTYELIEVKPTATPTFTPTIAPTPMRVVEPQVKPESVPTKAPTMIEILPDSIEGDPAADPKEEVKIPSIRDPLASPKPIVHEEKIYDPIPFLDDNIEFNKVAPQLSPTAAAAVESEEDRLTKQYEELMKKIDGK